MNFSDISRIADVLQLNQQQRLALASVVGASGAQGTAKVALNVHLRPSRILSQDPMEGRERRPSNDVTARLLSLLSPEVRKQFAEIEPKLLDWIRESESNAAHFMTDPLGALREAVPDADRSMFETLAAIRAQYARTKPDLPGVELVSVRLDAPVEEEKETSR